MNIKLGSGWGTRLKGRVEKYEFEVGVLDDKVHKDAVQQGLYQESALGSYAGGPVRKMSRIPGESTVGQVLVSNMKRLNVNLLQAPFQKQSSEIIKFTDYFLRYIIKQSGSSGLKRLENLLQAIVRNPILKQEYGMNSSGTADNKGFDRHLFDTGQMFKALRAKAIRKK